MNKQFLLIITMSTTSIGCMETSKNWQNLPREMQLSVVQQAIDRDINNALYKINVIKNGIDATDKWGYTALIRVVEKRDAVLDTVALLVRNGAQINRLDPNGMTPLYRAIESNTSDEVVKYLINQGADINLGSYSPVYEAAAKVNKGLVEYLIQKGADLRKKDKDGYTPAEQLFGTMLNL